MRPALVVLVAAAVAAPSHAAIARVVVAAPASLPARAYVAPVVPLQPGDQLSLTSADPFLLHSIQSEATGSDANPWCGPRNPGPESPANPRRFAIGRCPLFWSDLVVPHGTRPVLGLEALERGRAYGFYCSVFADDMTGVVLT